MRKAFLGVPLDALTMAQTMARIEAAIDRRERLQHVALNVAKFVHLQTDLELWRDVAGSDLVGVDGQGIILGARMFGIGIPERVTGVDVLEAVLARAAERGWRPYFLGATPEVLRRAIAATQAKHPSLRFAGSRDGYFKPEEEAAVIAAIAGSGADCLFIGMPTPRKERLLALHRDHLGVPFVMGVGGGLDVLAGHVSRAPGWVQRAGMEWLYRVVQEPRRLWRRYLTTNLAYARLLLLARLGVAPPTARRAAEEAA